MKVLVTGGRGFIGQWTCELLAIVGHEPVMLDRRRSVETPRYETFYGDIRDADTVTDAMAHVHGWIHLAGILGTQETIADPRPAATTNVLGGLNVLIAAKRYDLPGVNIGVGNYWMQNTYSITKHSVERLAGMMRDEIGLRVTTVRAVNAYGPRQEPVPPWGSSQVRKILPSFICRALSGLPIEVYGDGSQIMDMVRVQDVAATLMRTLEHTVEHPDMPIVEAATGADLQVIDIASMVRDEVARQTGRDPVDIEFLPMRPGEEPKSVVKGDPTYARDVLGVDFRPFHEGLPSTVEFFADRLGVR